MEYIVDNFIQDVLARLPPLAADDRPAVESGLCTMFREGYTIADAVALNSYLEEFYPGQDEATALKYISLIQKKYRRAD